MQSAAIFSHGLTYSRPMPVTLAAPPPPPSLQKLISTVLYEFVQALSILCNQIICRNNWSTRPPSLRQAIWFAEQIGTAKSCLNILRWSWHLWILGGNFQTSIEDHRCQKNFFLSSWPLPKRFDSDESLKAQLTILIFVAIYVKNSVSWVRSAVLHGIYCILYWNNLNAFVTKLASTRLTIIFVSKRLPTSATLSPWHFLNSH